MPLLPVDAETYPVLITVGNDLSVGTGFIIHDGTHVFIVTACHVLFRKHLELWNGQTITVRGRNNQGPYVLELDVDVLGGDSNIKKHSKRDVAVVNIGALKPRGDGHPGNKVVHPAGIKEVVMPPEGVWGAPPSMIKTFDDVHVGTDVLLFGFPTSLGRDETHIDRSRPLLRTGIIAGKTSDRQFVMDCPVYFGNSGGLVLSVDRQVGNTAFRCIGIALEMIPFVEEHRSKHFGTTSVSYENSGYSIVSPFDPVLELISSFDK